MNDCFAPSYAEARRKFLGSAQKAGATMRSYLHPRQSPAGDPLTTDTAWLGPADAEAVLVLIAGTHGVEGFCGSGVQVALLADSETQRLPDNVAMLLVHAINPFGFAWCRRVDENNIDVNRNWVEFAAPLPPNPAYESLRDAICPAGEGDETMWAACSAKLRAYAAMHGEAALQAAISAGQWSDPRGVFFGGHAPSWSRRTLTSILAEQMSHACSVALLDIHTGLGPYGHCERIVPHAPDDPGAVRAGLWFGLGGAAPGSVDSSSARVLGDSLTGAARLLPRAKVTSMALEFGVGPLKAMLDAVRADAWLHGSGGDPESPTGRRIKTGLKDCFFAEDERWKGMVLGQSRLLVRQALAGLSRG